MSNSYYYHSQFRYADSNARCPLKSSTTVLIQLYYLKFFLRIIKLQIYSLPIKTEVNVYI